MYGYNVCGIPSKINIIDEHTIIRKTLLGIGKGTLFLYKLNRLVI